MTTMDIILAITTGILLALSAIAVLAGPFVIGKPRHPLSPLDYLSVLFQTAAVVLMAGRIFGWW